MTTLKQRTFLYGYGRWNGLNSANGYRKGAVLSILGGRLAWRCYGGVAGKGEVSHWFWKRDLRIVSKSKSKSKSKWWSQSWEEGVGHLCLGKRSRGDDGESDHFKKCCGRGCGKADDIERDKGYPEASLHINWAIKEVIFVNSLLAALTCFRSLVK